MLIDTNNYHENRCEPDEDNNTHVIRNVDKK